MAAVIDQKRLYQLLSSEKNPAYKKTSDAFKRKNAEFEKARAKLWEAEGRLLGRILEKVMRTGGLDEEGLLALADETRDGWEARREKAIKRVTAGFQEHKEYAESSADFFCTSCMDMEYHFDFLDVGLDSALPFFDVAETPSIITASDSQIDEVVRVGLELSRIGFDLHRLIAHTCYATLALDISLPRTFKNMVGVQFDPGTLEEMRKDWKYLRYSRALEGVDPFIITRELLKMVHPRKWEMLLGSCTKREIVVAVPGPGSELPAFEQEGGAQQEVPVVERPEFRSVFSLINDVEKILSFGKGEAARFEENRLAWEKLMPGDFSGRKGAILSAVLAISAPAPESREGMLDALETHENEIFEAIVDGPQEAGEAAPSYEDLLEYAERFARKEDVPAEGAAGAGEAGGAKKGKVELKRPHESLEFPAEVSLEIGRAGLSEENLKRVLVYGLRLSSKKAAIGGKYFVLPIFRKNAERVVESGVAHPREVVEGIENFLYKHGVITYYKKGNVIMLNLKEELGDHNKPDEIGQPLLDSVVKWKVEFDRGNSPGKGNGNGKGDGEA